MFNVHHGEHNVNALCWFQKNLSKEVVKRLVVSMLIACVVREDPFPHYFCVDLILFIFFCFS